MGATRSLWDRIKSVPPVLYALASWGMTLGFSAVVTAPPVTDAVTIGLFFLVTLLVPAFSLMSFVHVTRLYQIDRWYLLRIVQLYAVLALVFANLFYIMIAVADPTPIYAGIHSPWVWLGESQGRRMYWENVWKAAVDCVYYSFATITTSPYGDIRPLTWYTKLLSNLEVLMGLGLVSIGLGRYFSLSDKA